MSEEYRKAGVDLDKVASLVGDIKNLSSRTHMPGVVSAVGGFCSLFDPGVTDPDYRGPLIAQSTDGVGTKLRAAGIMCPPHFWTSGADIVNHCINDILTSGAMPAIFHDYIAQDKLRPDDVVDILRGMTDACKAAGISLVGGETAQMQGTYKRGESDVVGFITGFVSRDDLIDGRGIRPGACLIGLASNGLHTNGFSLVNKIFSNVERPPGHKLPWPYIYYKEVGAQLYSVLLTHPHMSYLGPINTLREMGIAIKGIAHITGGGIPGNTLRILPDGICARVDKSAWDVPPIFRLIQKEGKVSDEEMFRIFNMGIGMIIVVTQRQKKAALRYLGQAGFEAYEIGRTEKGEKGVILE